jgi:hypothetical protein
MRNPGEVWFLPPDAVEGGDAKGRRHVLLTECEDQDDTGVFAYASTQTTEAVFGAAALLVDPERTPQGRSGQSGFERPTYIYPSRLVGASTDEMTRMVGRLVDELVELRELLRRALGIGAGVNTERLSSGRSWRGRIVRFSEIIQQEMDCAHGLIVTEPAYSIRQRYQVVVPVLDLREFESTGTDVVVEEKEWLPLLFGEAAAAAFAIEMIQTVFHPTDIQGEMVAVVDDETASRIDARLLQLFDL